jgi:hypothetical protein
MDGAMSVTYRRNPDIEAAPMQGESILFDPASNKFCLLNGTAAFVWEQLATPATIEHISQELCRHFDSAEPNRVEQDVREVLDRFVELLLVSPEALS